MLLRTRSFDQVTAYVPTFGNGRAMTSSISHSVFIVHSGFHQYGVICSCKPLVNPTLFQMDTVQLAPLYVAECKADALGSFSFASPKLELVRAGVSPGQAVVCCLELTGKCSTSSVRCRRLSPCLLLASRTLNPDLSEQVQLLFSCLY